MKAIIDGLRYDTDKAIKLGGMSHSNPGDFGHYAEALYKTPRSGRFFLAGTGGPRSHYAKTVRPGEWSGGSKITPMEPDEAQAWAERNLTVDETDAIFGDNIQDA